MLNLEKQSGMSSNTLMFENEYRVMFEAESRYWWYVSLRRWLCQLLRKTFPSPGKILDAGCGTGANAAAMTQLGHNVTAFDRSLLAIGLSRNYKERFSRLAASTVKLPFNDHTFDGIVSLDVLYLLSDTEEQFALEEFSRVLKPSGKLLLHLPAFSCLAGEHDQAVAGKRRYTLSSIRKKLDEAGLVFHSGGYRYVFFFPFLYLLRRIRRARTPKETPRSDLTIPIGPLNALFKFISSVEDILGRFVRFPFGTSVWALAYPRKKGTGNDG